MSARPRTKKAAATLPPTTLERIIAADNVKQRKAPKTPYQKLAEGAAKKQLEADYEASLKAYPLLPTPEPQYTKLVPGRRYRADYAFPDVRLIVEVDGSMWGRRNPQTGQWEQGKAGGHTSGTGYERDRLRDARCILFGWTVLRVTASMIASGDAAWYTQQIYSMLAARKTA